MPHCRSRHLMSVSNDPGHFFQTSTSLEKQKLRGLKANNTNGSPLITSSKIITFVLDPESTQSRLPRLFTGVSGGLARRVNLEVLVRRIKQRNCTTGLNIHKRHLNIQISSKTCSYKMASSTLPAATRISDSGH